MTTFHMAMTIPYAREWTKHYPNKGLFGTNEKPVSDENAFKYLDQLEEKGYEFVPCSDADEKGRCKGWNEK